MWKQSIKLWFIVIVGVSMVTACRSVLMTVQGVKKPKTEDAKSISDFMQRMHIDRYGTVISNFEGYFENCKLGICNVNVFNKEGKLIAMPGGTTSCGPDPAVFLRYADKQQRYEIANDMQIDSLAKTWLLPDGNGFHYMHSDSADFAVVITWSKWIGKKILQRDIVSCLQAMQENMKTRFDIILLNMDKQQLWGKENLSKVRFTRNAIHW